MRILVPLLSALLLTLTACGGDGGEGADGGAASGGASGGDSGERIDVGDDTALTWGDGDYGVVLAHGAAFDAASWTDQATAIAEAGTTVIALEDTSPESIAAAVEQLQGDGIDDVALAGGSAGADSILQLASEQPDLADQLVLLSPNTVVEGLGDEPKLFVASEGEPGTDVPQELADASPGDDNEVLIVDGDAHAQNVFDTDQGDEVLDAMLERLTPG